MSFVLATRFVDAIESGDHLHVSYGGFGTLSVSIVRSGSLVAAAGSLWGMPLGQDVRVYKPQPELERAEAAFQELDPSFMFTTTPVAISVNGATRLLKEGRLDIDHVSVFLRRKAGRLLGPDPGGGISNRSLCSIVAATTSQELLEIYGLKAKMW